MLAARLIESLAVVGSRKADGTANASGRVFVYAAGTTTSEPAYTSEDCGTAWTLTSGYIPLDVAGKAEIWVQAAVDVRIEDSDGAEISTFADVNKVGAVMVEVLNDNFTGAITDDVSGDVTQELGGQTDLDTVLSSLGGSLGPDGKYQESAGATARTYIEVIGEIHITPQDFGGRGDGVTYNDTAVSQAITRLTARGGGKLYYPPGTYRFAAETLLGSASANAEGISFEGAGSDATILIQDTAATNLFTAYGTGLRIKGMTLAHNSTSAGRAIEVRNGVGVMLEDIVTDGDFGYGLYLSATTYVTTLGCRFHAIDALATARGIFVGASCAHVGVFGGLINGGSTGYGIDINTYGAAHGDILLSGVAFAGSSSGGVVFYGNPIGGAFDGTGFSIIGCPTLGGLAIPIVPAGSGIGGLAVLPGDLIQFGNRIEGATTNILTGATFTPTPQHTGKIQRVRGTTTGLAYNVAVPSYIPTVRGYTFVLKCVNAAGGAVSGWTFAAGYKTAGAVTTDLHTTSLTFEYDLDAVVWREIGRTDTVT
jgi:hypothetical protein